MTAPIDRFSPSLKEPNLARIAAASGDATGAEEEEEDDDDDELEDEEEDDAVAEACIMAVCFFNSPSCFLRRSSASFSADDTQLPAA